MSSIKRPSPAMAISLIALFVALGGTGYAAVKINGKNIKNKTISGKKLKKNTLTGTQIRESKLGKVPKAKVADSAGTANALSAGAKAGFFAAEKVVSTGLVKLQASGNSEASSPARALFTKGPFTVTGKCFRNAGQMNREELVIGATSAEAGSDLDGGSPGTSNPHVTSISASPPGTFNSFVDAATFATPSGKTLALSFHMGVNGFGSPCFTAVSAVYGG